MNVGDIFTVEIPPVDGHEQAGLRPAIIVQANRFEKQLPTTVIVPLSSQLAAQNFPGTFLIQPDAENGLTMSSVALVFQLRAIDKKRLKRKIGKLNSTQLVELQKQMKDLLQLAT